MELAQAFALYTQLPEQEQQLLSRAAVKRVAPEGTLLHNGSADCQGLLVVCSGQLRAYLTSQDGREITLYRLLERDICLFSASCMISGMDFDVTVSAEKETEFWQIPADVYQGLMTRSALAANYTNQIMAQRLSEVMWLVEQVLWKSMDRRLAGFLLEESALEESDELRVTHEKIASHLGTAREVVSRMLQYFQKEGMVRLGRGSITLTDRKKLTALEKT